MKVRARKEAFIMKKTKSFLISTIITMTCFLILISTGTAIADMNRCPGEKIENPEIFELIKEGDTYHLTVKVDSSLDYTDIEVWPALDADCTVDEDDVWECTYSEIVEERKNIVVVDFIDSDQNCVVAWAKGFLEEEPERPQSANFVYTEQDAETPDNTEPTLDQELVETVPDLDAPNADPEPLQTKLPITESNASGGGS